MGGLGILLVVGLYIAIGLLVVIKSPGWWRLVALLAVIVIPTADAMWGRYVTLPRLCKDAGLKVYAKASIDGGFMRSTASDDLLKRFGFPFVEGIDGAGKVYRRSMRDGQPQVELDVKPRATYVFRTSRTGDGTRFLSEVFSIEERETGKPLAEARAHTFLGGWAEQLLARFTDAGRSGVKGCGWEAMNGDELIASVFGKGE